MDVSKYQVYRDGLLRHRWSIMLTTSVVWLIFFWQHVTFGGNALLLARNLIFIFFLILIFFYDWERSEIPDQLIYPTFAVTVILQLILQPDWRSLIYGGTIGGLFFLTQFLLSRGAWLGGGDVKLGLVIGFMVGWPQLLFTLIVAYVTGSLVGLLLILGRKKTWRSELPFGTFLSVATTLTLFFGARVTDAYWRFVF